MSRYLEIARTGKNDWWRYLLSFPGILIGWLLIGSIPIILLSVYVMSDQDPATQISATGFSGVPVLLDFTATMLTFIPFIVATLLAVRFVHGRPLRTLVTAAGAIRWTRVLAGAGVWFVIAVLVAIVESLLYPGRYVLTFQPKVLAVYAVVALVLIPIQTSSEELFFRGYLLQWMGLRLKNKWVLAFINGILFFLPHYANPEMSVNWVLMGLNYFSSGFFLSFITLQDDGMELALGLHAANNLFSALFANYTTSALVSPALFTVQTLDATYGLIFVIVGMGVFYSVFFLKRARQPARETTLE